MRRRIAHIQSLLMKNGLTYKPTQLIEGELMELVILITVVWLVATWCYSNGKRDGSRKGYGVGRSHERRQRNNRRRR